MQITQCLRAQIKQQVEFSPLAARQLIAKIAPPDMSIHTQKLVGGKIFLGQFHSIGIKIRIRSAIYDTITFE